MNSKRILESLKAAVDESQVQEVYNGMLKDAFPGIQIIRPCRCDGYFEFNVSKLKKDRILRCICEFKNDMDLSKKSERSKILAQIVFYMKKFESEGRPLPNVAFVGDKNECFIVHTNYLVKWLDLEDVDWTVAPCHAASQTTLFEALVTDKSRNVFVYDVKDGFNFQEITDQLRAQAAGDARYIHITEHNVGKIFKTFCDKVLKDAKKISPNDLVSLFYAAICDHKNCYPVETNILGARGKKYRINADNWKSFQTLFAYVESPSQKAKLAAIADRLIADMTRRRQGAFFTPTEWVDEAHRRIAAFLGDNWRDEYVVVDTSCGTKNLERDYRFSELYLSTLESAELEISRQYCPEAKATATLDFLNSTDEELFAAHPGLEDALKANKKFIWFQNPPYATSAVKGATGKTKGKGATNKTAINKQMRKDKIGGCSEQLYAQFLYRIMQLKKKYNATNFVLAFFCNPNYLTGTMFKKFRESFFKEFKFENGMLFNAGHFADTSANWGINFSIWSSGETTDKTMFKHDLMDINNNGDIVKVGEKSLYNIDGNMSLGDWIREIGKVEKEDSVPLMSALNVKNDGRVYFDRWSAGSLGYMYCKGNSIRENTQDTAIMSSIFNIGHGVDILSVNFARCCAAFAARRLVSCDWMNNQDQYTAPNVNDPAYKQFEANALIYSLFESKSQQSSLRGIEYKGKKWDVRNQFCWYSKAEAQRLADENGLDEVYNDVRTSQDPYMVKALAEAEGLMSDEAKTVLAKALELIEKSFKYRGQFADDWPEYQTDKAWDLGWYQIKAMLKTYMPKELEEFRGLVKKLADKMRPQVYSLGFLRV